MSMMENSEALVEAAKATTEIAATGGKAIDAAREAGGFISKYVGGSLEQAMGIFEDKLKYHRWERSVRLMKRADQFLAEVGLQSPSRRVPLKIAVPLLQAASMEEDDTLQDRWANLLVNAANAGSVVEVNRSYIAILEELSPIEVQILDVVYALSFDDKQNIDVWTGSLPHHARLRTEEDSQEFSVSEQIPEELRLALANLARLGCIKLVPSWGGDNYTSLNPTLLGSKFVSACKLKFT